MCYTDGVTEAANAAWEQFGEERLYELIESMPRELGAREIAERIMAALALHLGDQEPQDDVTILVLRALEPVGACENAEPQCEAVAAE